MKKLTKILKACANENRLKILILLKNEKSSVGQISKKINLSLKATSQHLHNLDAVDLVRKERRGNNIYYSLARFPQDSLRRKIVDIIETIK